MTVRRSVLGLARDVPLSLIAGATAVDGLEATPPHSPADFKASFRVQFDQWEQFMRRSSVKLD